MRTERAASISVFSLVSLLRGENLGAPHTVFAGGELYVSHRFAAEAEQVLQREVAESGLDHRELVDLLTVVQHATVEYYGWVTGVDDDYAVLVASLGRRAVSVVRSGHDVRFERCAADRMVATLVARLPDVPVARGDAISVSHADFQPTSAGTVLRRSTPSRPKEARRLDELLDARRVSVTKLYAAKRDDEGVRQRSDRWLTLLDVTDGRWALSVRQTRRGKWINAAPGTPRLVEDGLEELARSIR
jgi:hypothetical protein